VFLPDFASFAVKVEVKRIRRQLCDKEKGSLSLEEAFLFFSFDVMLEFGLARASRFESKWSAALSRLIAARDVFALLASSLKF